MTLMILTTILVIVIVHSTSRLEFLVEVMFSSVNCNWRLHLISFSLLSTLVIHFFFVFTVDLKVFTL